MEKYSISKINRKRDDMTVQRFFYSFRLPCHVNLSLITYNTYKNKIQYIYYSLRPTENDHILEWHGVLGEIFVCDRLQKK